MSVRGCVRIDTVVLIVELDLFFDTGQFFESFLSFFYLEISLEV